MLLMGCDSGRLMSNKVMSPASKHYLLCKIKIMFILTWLLHLSRLCLLILKLDKLTDWIVFCCLILTQGIHLSIHGHLNRMRPQRRWWHFDLSIFLGHYWRSIMSKCIYMNYSWLAFIFLIMSRLCSVVFMGLDCLMQLGCL